MPAPKLAPGVFYTRRALGAGSPIAFLFPGQGSQYPNMMRDLASGLDEVATCFDQADEVLADCFEKPLSRFVFPPTTFDNAEREQNINALKATDVAQPALGASSVAMLRLLASFGVKPDMTAGHSYGELVALHAAGSMDASALYRLSWLRGEAIVGTIRDGAGSDLGQMLAVRANEATVREHLGACAEVWLANCNSPTQTVVSGSTI